MRRRALLGTVIPTSLRADPTLIAALRTGGLHIYLRHAITDLSQADRGRLDDRAGQRNLSAAGIAQAEALGAAWRRRRLPLGAVLASPVFRALDTARLAFGAANVQVEPFLTADDYTPDAGQFSRNIEQTRWHLAAPPVSGNDVLVGHIVPLRMILHRALSQAEYPEGCLAIFHPTTGFLGFLPAEALISP